MSLDEAYKEWEQEMTLHDKNCQIAELLREKYNMVAESNEMAMIQGMLEIGETCGKNAIQLSSISCPRPEFEQRKAEGNI